MREKTMSEFECNFSRYKDVPIAIYGLGIKTKMVLDSAGDFNVVGLVANNRIGEMVFGYKVLSIDDIQDRAEMVIIAAHYCYVKIIYQRIRHIEQKGITICDMSGQDLAERYSSDETVTGNPYWISDEEKLKRAIDTHDIISFDIFDTLIMRKVLMPSQIFDIAERKLRETGVDFPFKEERILAEHRLTSAGACPNIDEIYTELARGAAIDQEKTQIFKSLEFETEKKYITPREVMVEAFQYAQAHGKRVWLLSDMYYGKEQMKELLRCCSINVADDNIIVSCDIRKSKSAGTLYEYYLNQAGDGSRLHIGDNMYADIKMPSHYGIDTYYIMNANDMILESSICPVLEKASTLDDHIALGIFAAEILNDPFALSGSKGRLRIDDLFTLGYICFAPLTLCFLTWMMKILKGQKNSVVLFSARDGFLIRELYRTVSLDFPEEAFPKDFYLYISRRAVTVSAIETEADIIDIVNQELQKTVGDLRIRLEQHLGIPFPKEDPVLARSLMDTYDEKDRQEITERVLQFKEEILDNAARERGGYLRYLNSVGLDRYGVIWLFDLFTKGTCYGKLKKLTERSDIRLLCYAVKDVPNECIPDVEEISSMLGNLNINARWFFGKVYQLFETVYASPDGQLRCMDGDGRPLFEEDSAYNHERLKDAQKGISEFVREFFATEGNCWNRTISPEFADEMCSLVYPSRSAVSDSITENFNYEDIFDSEISDNIWKQLI